MKLKNMLSMLVLVMLLLASCSKENKDNPSEMIAGKESKTWKAKKETNSQGEKEKLNSQEKDQEIKFFANGKFNMSSDTETESGTWSYSANTGTLSLTFSSDQTYSENFKVLELNDDKMKVQASDGSEMVMTAD
jgi:outer membrane biogenesis lipoprotein LolB